MTSQDTDYVADIVNACRLIGTFVSDHDVESFTKAEAAYFATVQQVLIIGEATKHLSVEFRDAHPSIPWSDIARMRDKLIHHYGRIDVNEVWSTATRDVPRLMAYLGPIIPQEPTR